MCLVLVVVVVHSVIVIIILYSSIWSVPGTQWDWDKIGHMTMGPVHNGTWT